MNSFLPINNKKISVLGAGKSGVAAAKLAYNLGANVFISDINVKNKISIKGVKSEFGKHSERILESDIVIKSPGINNSSNLIQKIINHSIPIVSEIEFASWFTNGFIIALTGTNGKSTTVELIYNILKNYGLNTFLSGNIGTPFSEVVLSEIINKVNDEKFHVLEISSFQLEDIKYFKPDISIILNIKPDHLDRYDCFQDYVNQKLKILVNQDSNCYTIINESDIQDFQNKKNINTIKFSSLKDTKFLVNGKSRLININNSNLLGTHNLENILVSILVSELCGVSDDVCLNTINKFNPPNHRLEKLNFNSNVTFYNDSKATNLPATIAAINTLDKNIILILGGIDKNKSNFCVLEKYKNKIKNIILYGDSRKFIEKQISSYFNIFSFSNFDQAIKKSISLSDSGDNILCSPACASFDQFNNYKDRGNCFKKIISDHYAKN